MANPILYKVVAVKPPHGHGEVEAQQIEDELSKWGTDGWDLFDMMERRMEKTQSAGTNPQNSVRVSLVVAVICVFRKNSA